MADDAQSMDMGEFMDTYSSVIDMAGDFWEDHQKTSESNEGELSRLKETVRHCRRRISGQGRRGRQVF
jgi:hypothetical protein